MLDTVRRLSVIVLLAGCAGADGAAGPQGPQGPTGQQGPPGPTNFFSATGVLNGSGGATVPLTGVPAGARPSINCYITNQLTQPVAWLQVTDGNPASSGTSVCGLVLSNNQWNAVMINAPPLWFYFVSVVW